MDAYCLEEPCKAKSITPTLLGMQCRGKYSIIHVYKYRFTLVLSYDIISDLRINVLEEGCDKVI